MGQPESGLQEKFHQWLQIESVPNDLVNSKSIGHDEAGLWQEVIGLRLREGRELAWSHSARH